MLAERTTRASEALVKQAVHPLATLIRGFGSARGVVGGAVNTVGRTVGGAVNTAGGFVVKQAPKAFPTALAYGATAAGAGKCAQETELKML